MGRKLGVASEAISGDDHGEVSRALPINPPKLAIANREQQRSDTALPYYSKWRKSAWEWEPSEANNKYPSVDFYSVTDNADREDDDDTFTLRWINGKEVSLLFESNSSTQEHREALAVRAIHLILLNDWLIDTC